ncbi:MAG: hypothetical protein GF332_02130 [Candidatus Moranbacteria bacterium]|nr:hypothetical protein [Candidatus Moranbacteria bacterium]
MPRLELFGGGRKGMEKFHRSDILELIFNFKRKTKMKNFFKIVVIVLIFLIVFIIFHGNILAIFSNDSKDFDCGLDMSDLNALGGNGSKLEDDINFLSKKFIKDIDLHNLELENLLKDDIPKTKRKFSKEKGSFEEEIIDPKNMNDDFINERIVKNQIAISLINEMIDKKYVLNEDEMEYVLDVGEYVNLKNTVKLKLIYSIKLFREGKQKEAFNEVFRVMEFGDLIEKYGNSMLAYVYGLGFKEQSFIVYEYFLNQYLDLDRAELSNFNEILASYINQSQENYILSLKKDCIAFNFLVDQLNESLDKKTVDVHGKNYSSRFIKNDFYFKPNKTKKTHCEHISLILNLAKGDFYSENINKDMMSLHDWSLKHSTNLGLAKMSKYRIVFVPNIIGGELLDVADSVTGATLSSYYEYRLKINVLRVKTAMKINLINGGQHPPDKLEDLIGHGLEKIPKDSFGGENLMYDKEKKIIFSMGKRFKSQETTLEDYEKYNQDHIFKIGF